MVVDPVCGMTLAPAAAVATAHSDGTRAAQPTSLPSRENDEGNVMVTVTPLGLSKTGDTVAFRSPAQYPRRAAHPGYGSGRDT